MRRPDRQAGCHTEPSRSDRPGYFGDHVGLAWQHKVVRAIRNTSPITAIAWMMLAAGALGALFATFIAPFHPNANHLQDYMQGPSRTYLLGTDELGRDVLSRIIHGGRVSLLSGVVGTATAVVIGSVVGMCSALLKGYTDMFLQRVMDSLQSIPGLILAMSVVIITGPSLWGLSFAVGLTLSPRVNRVVRAASLEVVASSYVEAARAVGAANTRIVVYHILPNVATVILIMFSITIGATILIVAALDFLGLGVQQPTASWGGMIGGSARTTFLAVPTLALFPGLVLACTVWAFNMVGDDLRDRLDPRMRGAR